MGPTKLGSWGYVLWLSSMAAMFASYGIAGAVRKYVADLLAEKRYELVHPLIRLTVIVQLTLVGALSTLGILWVRYSLPPDQHRFATIAMVSFMPMGVMSIATTMNGAIERLEFNAVASMTGTLTIAVLTLTSLWLGWDLEGLALALIVGRVCDTCIRWTFARKHFPKYLAELGYVAPTNGPRAALPKTLKVELLHFFVDATILLVLRLVIWNRSAVFFLERLCDMSQLAFYSVASTFASLPTQLALPLTNAATSSLFAERGRGGANFQRYTIIYWRYLALVVAPCAVGLCVLSGPVVLTLYGDKYAPAVPVLMVSMLLGIIPALVDPASTYVTAENGQRKLVRWSLVAAGIVLVLDWVFVKAFCSLGAAFADGLGKGVTTLGIWFIASRAFGLKLPYGYGVRLLLAAAFMGIVVAPVALTAPAFVSMVVGPPLGVLAFFVGLRFARALDVEDADRLQAIERVLPWRVRSAFVRCLHWVCRSPKVNPA